MIIMTLWIRIQETIFGLVRLSFGLKKNDPVWPKLDVFSSFFFVLQAGLGCVQKGFKGILKIMLKKN